MSKESWLEAFYPVPANKVSAADAISHSLRKWRGCTHEMLHKHDLYGPPIVIDESTCALCYRFIENNCKWCPLAIARRGVSCDSAASDETEGPFTFYAYHGDPSRMIYALLKAAEYAELQSSQQKVKG